MAKNSMTIEVSPEIAAAQAQLKEAETARDEAYRIADDPGQLIGTGRWRRLPMVESEATRLKSDANHKLRQAQRQLDAARRPKLPLTEARERLAAAEAQRDEALARLAQINADTESSAPDRQLAALDADRAGAARAVRRAMILVDVAKATLADAEQREREQRRPLLEKLARGIAQRLDAKLDEIAVIVAEAEALHEQAAAARCSFESPIFPGAAPAAVSFWRERQRKLGRLA